MYGLPRKPPLVTWVVVVVDTMVRSSPCIRNGARNPTLAPESSRAAFSQWVPTYLWSACLLKAYDPTCSEINIADCPKNCVPGNEDIPSYNYLYTYAVKSNS